VSVVVPTYQRRELVKRAVASVRAQTFRDFELIVVDDGSTDGTGDTVASLGGDIRYSWQENRGPASARNAAIHLARAPIVAFLDSDDRWLPHHLEVAVRALARHPEAVLACTCPRFAIAGHEDPDEARLFDALPGLLIDTFFGWPSCTVALREKIVAVGGFDERLEVAEDAELFLRLAALGPFSVIRHRTIVRQRTPGSLMDWARRHGRFLAAIELIAESGASIVEATSRHDRDELVARARGKLHYVAALRSLLHGDEAAARTSLAEACRLIPELSHDPWLFARRVKTIAYEQDDLLRQYATTAALWPDQNADTALFLRVLAALLALRLGHVAQAARLACRRPFLLRPGFVRRTRPAWALIAREACQGRRHRSDAGLADAELVAPD
jgi:glycosyltransferase involved in cell wall biosynthesis